MTSNSWDENSTDESTALTNVLGIIWGSMCFEMSAFIAVFPGTIVVQAGLRFIAAAPPSAFQMLSLLM